MMGQYHFMLWFINSDNIPDSIRATIYIFGRLAGPFFILIAGISAILFYHRQKETTRMLPDPALLWATIKRGAFLILLPLPLNVAASYIFHSSDFWEWNIIQLLGLAILFTVFAARYGFVFLPVAAAIIICLESLSTDSFLTTGIWPPVPWLIYFFVGNTFGHLIYRYTFYGNRSRDLLLVVALLLFGIALSLLTRQAGGIYQVLLIRTSIPAIIIISLLFLGTLSLLEGTIHKAPFRLVGFLRNIGLVALSVYYLHVFFKYSIVLASTSVIRMAPKTEWGVFHWLSINAVFWIGLFLFVQFFWSGHRFCYGVEWFMSKLVSGRSVVS